MTLLVQTERILANFRILQKQAGGTPLIPTLEANAYGLGDVAVAQLLAGAGIKTVAVSRLEEAVRIAENVRGLDILLLTPYAGEEDITAILKNDIIAAVGSNDSAVLISSLSAAGRGYSFVLISAWAGLAICLRMWSRPLKPSTIWRM